MPGIHKRFAPSSLARIRDCPGSLQFCESLSHDQLDDSDTIWSRRGTSAHAVGEMVLTSYDQASNAFRAIPSDYQGQEVEGVLIDDELVQNVEVYVDHLARLLPKFDQFDVEKTLDLTHTDIPNGHECGGTMDFLGCIRFGTLYVNDYKNGRVFVDVNDNIQLLTYALCAYMEYSTKFFFRDVKIAVSQPAAFADQGPIRSRRYSVKYLMTTFKDHLSDIIVKALDDNAPIIPGESQCMWCPGRVQCPKVAEMVHDQAMTEFSEAGAFNPPAVETLSREQRLHICRYGSMFKDYVDAVIEFERRQALNTSVPTGFKLVKKVTHRRYKTEKENPNITPERIRKALRRLGLSPMDYSKPLEMKTPSQLETAMRKKGVDPKLVGKFMSQFVFKPDGGEKLVLESEPGKPVDPLLDDFEDVLDK